MKEYIIKVDDEKPDIIGNMPLVEKAKELVRCKDCEWYYPIAAFCDNCGLPREETFFCADGRRK